MSPKRTNPSWRDLLDRSLEAAIVPSFTSIGHDARRSAFGWDDAGPESSLEGKRIVVTGSTSGLGLAAATRFASLGAEVWIIGRDAERAERARDSISAATDNPSVVAAAADLTRLDDVRDLAARILAAGGETHGIVHNAGALFDERADTVDGLERTFALHVAAPFLLTSELINTLDHGSRIVWVSSGGMYAQAIELDDLQSTQPPFRGSVVYARAKRAQVVLSRLWAERLASRGVMVHSMHPGWADTPGVAEALPAFHRLVGPVLRTPAQGADTVVWLMTDDKATEQSGRFWHDRRVRPTERLPWTATSDADATALWNAVADATGVDADIGLDPGTAND